MLQFIVAYKVITLFMSQCYRFYYGNILLVTKFYLFFFKINDLKRNLLWRENRRSNAQRCEFVQGKWNKMLSLSCLLLEFKPCFVKSHFSHMAFWDFNFIRAIKIYIYIFLSDHNFNKWGFQYIKNNALPPKMKKLKKKKKGCSPFSVTLICLKRQNDIVWLLTDAEPKQFEILWHSRFTPMTLSATFNAIKSSNVISWKSVRSRSLSLSLPLFRDSIAFCLATELNKNTILVTDG